MSEEMPSRLHQFMKHYYALIENQTVALYLRSKSIPAPFDPESSLDILWDLHRNFTPEVYRNNEFRNLPPTVPSLLDLKIHLSRRMLHACNFCNHKCKVDRTTGGLGYCGQSNRSYISSAFLHMGEEAPLVPSGTIFFNGCTFDCAFCQNFDISSRGKKKVKIINGAKILSAQEVDGPSLALLATALHKQGARNINYVGGDPTPHIHTILDSMKFLKDNVCQLWNSNLYLSENALWLLMDVIDVWLPDLKYGNNDCGKKYSGISQYWDILTRNLTLLYNHGSKNIIIRHLVMPGHIECCTKPLLSWIAREIPHVVINIMGQYHPDYKISAKNFPEINRRVTSAEMQSAFVHADQLNLEYHSVS
ncbi:MAG: radical SAM protein [Promethearchaeota archaeon]